jgi:hypothetical protein
MLIVNDAVDHESGLVQHSLRICSQDRFREALALILRSILLAIFTNEAIDSQVGR